MFPGDRSPLGTLEVDLGDAVVLEDRDALLADVDAHEELALRGRELRALLRDAAPGLVRAALAALRADLFLLLLRLARLRLGLLRRRGRRRGRRGLLSPLPPRVPRRRFGRVGSAVLCSSPPALAGIVVTSVGGTGAAACGAGACSGSLRFRRNQESGKRCLLARRAAERRLPQGAGARAGLSGAKTRALLVPGYQCPRRRPSVRSGTYASAQ
jgi:hypothetical protein